jgi:hypothetical protein
MIGAIRRGRMAAVLLWLGPLTAAAAAQTDADARLFGAPRPLVEWPGARGAISRGATIAFSRDGAIARLDIVAGATLGAYDGTGALLFRFRRAPGAD